MVANQLCRIVVGISSQIGQDGHRDMGDVSTYGKIIRFDETSRFEFLCRYSEIQVGGIWANVLIQGGGISAKYCNWYNYRRNGNVAVPGLFISSDGKQGGNYSEWRSRKKKLSEYLTLSLGTTFLGS